MPWLKFVAKKEPQKAADLKKQCDFKAGLDKLKVAEQFVKASQEQMRTQQFAIPSYEKPRS